MTPHQQLAALIAKWLASAALKLAILQLAAGLE